MRTTLIVRTQLRCRSGFSSEISLAERLGIVVGARHCCRAPTNCPSLAGRHLRKSYATIRQNPTRQAEKFREERYQTMSENESAHTEAAADKPDESQVADAA